jgi:glycosyltransferase involved in cell wall biosynthesis
MKIFMGLGEVSGNYKNLKQGFEKIGVECTFINLSGHKFNYGGDDVPNNLVELAKWLSYKRISTPKSSLFKKIFWSTLQEFTKGILFIWAITKFDVFIFSSYSTFLRFYDYPILKFFNKKIITQFHGSDIRPPYINGKYMSKEVNIGVSNSIKLSKKIKKRLEIIEKYADHIISIPPQSQFLKKPFIVRLFLGLSLNENSIIQQTFKPNKKIRILHAPSNPHVKGTKDIREAISNLKARGFDFDYIEISGVSNSTVVEEISKSDFVIDQLYSDYPLPRFATEAAMLCKPSIVGGYAQNLWEELLPKDQMPTSIYCLPENIETEIEKLLTDHEFRVQMGEKARGFIERQWDSTKVAIRYLEVIEGKFPDSWLYDPLDINYFKGVGLNEVEIKHTFSSIIDEYGINGLQLNDKKQLEELILRFTKME